MPRVVWWMTLVFPMLGKSQGLVGPSKEVQFSLKKQDDDGIGSTSKPERDLTEGFTIDDTEGYGHVNDCHKYFLVS